VKKKAIMAMLKYYAAKGTPVPETADNLRIYLAAQEAANLPLTVHLDDTAVFTRKCQH
jgi:hypothetical protein